MDEVYLTPEQVAEKLQLAVETVYRWLRSGKLRGARISQKAWRVAERDLRSFMTKQNVSELLFEEYVAEHRLGAPDREPVVPGKKRRVDYRLSFKDQPLWFEVKEFAEDPNFLGGGAYDPYIGIRKKIDKASEKFREYAGESCSLILYNRNLNLVDICTPFVVLGAMLGNVSWSIPIDVEKGAVSGSARQSFSAGGKMINPHTKTPINTRISAVIALERFPVGQKQFRITLAKKERDEDRRVLWEESHELFQRQEDTYERTTLRALVYENPFTSHRLPSEIFTGPYDVRWGPETGAPYINRLYAGTDLEKLEAEEDELGLNLSPLQRQAKERQRKRSSD
jgi:excisionase family DNA binding protein